ncbi:hypothetical protein [Azospirillum argentinense]|uniref:Phosphoribosyltransferase n=1 Tax=Azospirillum brasilense TaxID=192 RepID=A0A4D8QCT3_AZOBR|nr:hypothetical protein [Azospirillum argentinense]QCO07524.1 hypothetical protein D3867_37200 [Azospirillum argentinense]
MVAAPGEPAIGSLVWRPAFRSRNAVAYLVTRSWRADVKKPDIGALKEAKRCCAPEVIGAAAADVVTVARTLGGPLDGWTVTTVPCGHSRRHDCFGKQLAQRCAVLLGLPFVQVWADRFVSGVSHPKEFAKLPPLEWEQEPPGPMLLVDDVATSGWHIEEGLNALRGRGVAALGLVWIGGEVSPDRAYPRRREAAPAGPFDRSWIPGAGR